jgi:hypothetical protein
MSLWASTTAPKVPLDAADGDEAESVRARFREPKISGYPANPSIFYLRNTQMFLAVKNHCTLFPILSLVLECYCMVTHL